MSKAKKDYINEKIYGLPKPEREGYNTRHKHFNKPAYIHKVTTNGCGYFKVHIKRGGVSKIKYFKTQKEAELFVIFLRENKYL
jgi:hypothetical protein